MAYYRAPSSSSSSASIPVPTGYDYEVFLSFRGPDTRATFTDHLYNVLKNAGIRVFRDDEELRKGEAIGSKLLKAMTQSKISIPIFSRGYARSKWCLEEAVQMVKCMEATEQDINDKTEEISCALRSSILAPEENLT
ncbi:hypothetical protein CRG98_030382 [Punica granatum]|uniref:ADP-ribosyl cyclase/cyclic ADP-ribose hydrolase n=1 Tax=Punica granatum TaxID=22663 RepID=A0A2I0IZP9_PUNGR|nr:hypothetical protein CRG98_030382 [Punica granatum]